MDVLIILILTSLGVAAAFLGGFIWAVKSGQYEDTSTPALRVLTEESASVTGRSRLFSPEPVSKIDGDDDPPTGTGVSPVLPASHFSKTLQSKSKKT